ncbi:MAG: type II CAAX prenyl endopeptidase Rce1 family protein [Thermoanaerobaculia bacterium]
MPPRPTRSARTARGQGCGEKSRRPGPFLRGHFLLFEKRPAPEYSATAGFRLLAAFAVLEFVLGPRLSLLPRLGLPSPSAWLRMSILFLLVLAAVRLWARVDLDDLGFLPWGRWTATEKLYLFQIFVLARRLGRLLGPLVANLVFTFGPLHFYHFSVHGLSLQAALVFAATFGIGLFFTVLFHRTQNIWIVGLFHGLGNAYINGAPEIAGLAGQV